MDNHVKNHTISIICSTYREFKKHELQRAVKSVIEQTYPHWELIIVGDQTPFDSEIRSYLKKINDPRVIFINCVQRGGILSPGTAPKKIGVQKATGSFMAFLDADNFYAKNHLHQSVEAFKNNPKLDLVYGNTIVSLPRSHPLRRITQFYWRKPTWNKKRAYLLERSNFLDMSEPVFKREAYNSTHGLDESHHATDWLLWRALVKNGHGNFYHSQHTALVYQTSSFLHHLQFFLLMLLQKFRIPYVSQKLTFIQKGISKRFQKKHNVL